MLAKLNALRRPQQSLPGYYDLPGSAMLPGGDLRASPTTQGQPRSISGIEFPGTPDPGISSDPVYGNTLGLPTGNGLNNAFPPGKGQYFQYLDGNDLQGSSYGPSLTHDIPGEPTVYAPGGNTAPKAPRATAAPPVTAYPYAAAAPDWLANATNQVPTDAEGFPIPGAGGNAKAPNWAINASRPTAPWGWGPNYVDPIGAGSFFPGLVGWNAGNAGFNPSAGEGGISGGARWTASHPLGALAARFGLSGRQGGGGGVDFGMKFK